MCKNLTTKELLVINKVSVKKEDSFIYKFDRLQTFNISEFETIEKELISLIDDYKTNGKTENFNLVLSNVITCFEHILFLFYCHYNKNDTYKIKNIEEVENTKDIASIYISIRAISNELILV